MKNKNILYPIFSDWYHGGTVYLYSDPHFSDKDAYTKRGLFPKYTIEELDDMQITNINKCVGKLDTIIFLGDIGNLECIKKIRGYKVLIMGNHEIGRTRYERKETYTSVNDLQPDQVKKLLEGEARPVYINEQRYLYTDNKLFDEVYDGPLVISDRIILTHVPVQIPGLLNIHGHDHNGSLFVSKLLVKYDADMSSDVLFADQIETIKHYNIQNINVSAEWIAYTPVRLDKIIESGVLRDWKNLNELATAKANKRRGK